MYSPAVADMISMNTGMSRDALGAQIVTQTLDNLNGLGATAFAYSAGVRSATGLSNSSDYQFQTSALNAAYSGIGTFVNVMS